ncbi:MAG: flagellar motor switch protein FliN [Christensenellales bacterium]|jgi:flagellar motor switch protein FliN/FliY
MSNLSQDEIDRMLHAGTENAAPAEPPRDAGGQGGPEVLFDIGARMAEAAGEALQASFKMPVSAAAERTGMETLANVVAEYQETMLLMEGTYTSGLEGGALLLLKEQDAPLLKGIIEAAGGDGAEAEDGGPLAAALKGVFAVQDMVLSGMTATAVETVTGELVPFSPESPGMLRWVGDPEPMAAVHLEIAVEGAMRFRMVELMHRDTLRSLEAVLGPKEGGEAAVEDGRPQAKEPGPNVASNGQEAAVEPQKPSKSMGEIRSMKAKEQQKTVQNVMYQSFEKQPEQYRKGTPDNIGLIIDMPLQVSVELGRVRMSIREILAFNIGSIIELDRMADDLVDVKVNGKLIAQGEIVVVDENYGVRITDILSPERRVNSY